MNGQPTIRLGFFVDGEVVDGGGQVGFGGFEGGGTGGEFGLGGLDFVLRGVQVVDEAVAGALVGGVEGGDVGALALFFAAEVSELGVGLIDGGLGVSDLAADVEDGLECGFESGGVVGVVEDVGELVIVGVGELIAVYLVVLQADGQAHGFARRGFDAETVDGGGGFFRLGVGFKAEALLDVVFDHNGAAVGGGVVDDVRNLADFGAMDAQHSLGGADEGDAADVFVAFGGDVDGLVGGVGEQAALVGVDGIEETFAAEVAVFDESEAAAVEGETGGVFDPERAERLRGVVAVG